MSEIAGIIDTLESRIEKLLAKASRLEKQVGELQGEVLRSADFIKKQAAEIETLRSGQETLRMANALLGSDDNKRDTKLKINSLIREIDYCIAQLAD